MDKLEVHIGFDDIDTPHGGCTTHYASQLLVRWIKRGIELIDYPNLIRLNPGVPWKTRGNGSVVLRFLVDSVDEAIDYFEEAVVTATNYLDEYSRGWREYSQPVVVMYIGEVNKLLKWFGRKALYDVIPIDLAMRIASKLKQQLYYRVLGRGAKGLIGSLAGIGNRLVNTDYTYELLAYRSPEYIGKSRSVDPTSVLYMDKLYGNETILNYDYEENRPLITPHGPDPVLLGIRGEKPDILLKAFNKLKVGEPVPLAVIYRTNQHTDAHLHEINSLAEAYPYRSIKIHAYVASKPIRIQGGHVIFKITDGKDVVDVAVYQPTGKLRDIASKLLPGDFIEVMGVVRPPSSKHGKTINLEKLRVVMIKPAVVLENPRCPRCGARMKSAGRNKGFKCPRCGFKSRSLSKVRKIIPRDLKPGWYEPPPRAFKHLMKPLKRIGKEKTSFPPRYKPRNFILVNGKIYA
ncbi:MAG: tRNA(Ile)(2)-agmatinylcytidine synthase [Thermoprotei archaeon]